MPPAPRTYPLAITLRVWTFHAQCVGAVNERLRESLPARATPRSIYVLDGDRELHFDTISGKLHGDDIDTRDRNACWIAWIDWDACDATAQAAWAKAVRNATEDRNRTTCTPERLQADLDDATRRYRGGAARVEVRAERVASLYRGVLHLAHQLGKPYIADAAGTIVTTAIRLDDAHRTESAPLPFSQLARDVRDHAERIRTVERIAQVSAKPLKPEPHALIWELVAAVLQWSAKREAERWAAILLRNVTPPAAVQPDVR